MAGSDHEGHRRRRFQPFKKLQRLFRRRGKTADGDDPPDPPVLPDDPPASPQAKRRRPGKSSSPNKYRLSMSHDSIFQTGGEQSAGMDSATSIPSLPSSSSRLAAELRSVLTKKRGDDADDDSGLPRSPATPPDSGRLQGLKGQTGKSGGSCSDGSLLSIYSTGTGTGTDDDIFGPLSEHSSKLSLSRDQDSLDLKPAGALSHAAAKHRIAVRPRRNHGASRPRRAGPPAASLPTTLEEESTAPDQQSQSPPEPAPDAAVGAKDVPPTRPERGRATLPTAGATERPTSVQRSRSTIADRRLRDLSPRKLWGRDGSEPTEKKSEGFFSRLFGSRRSGRKRKSGGKEAEGAPRQLPKPASEGEDKPAPFVRAAPVVSEADHPALPAEGVLDAGAIGRPADTVSEAHQLVAPTAGTPAHGAEGVGSQSQEEQEKEREEEEEMVVSPEKPKTTSQQQADWEELRESSGQVDCAASQVGTPLPSPSKCSDIVEAVDQSHPVMQPVQEQESAVRQQHDLKQRGDTSAEDEEDGDESPPVLRRRRGVPEQPPTAGPSQARHSSGSQKLSWVEAELRYTPPRDPVSMTSSGHELRKTWVKEEAPNTPPTAEEEVQRTPSWVKEQLRKTPLSGPELRKTWIKEQPKALPPEDSETQHSPLSLTNEFRKSSPPVEEAPRTASWVTEEVQSSPGQPEGPSVTAPAGLAPSRPSRRPASAADPSLASAAGSRRSGDFSVLTEAGERRRRSAALVFGRSEPAAAAECGPRSLDSAVQLSAGRDGPSAPDETAERRRSAPDADPAVSPADGARIGSMATDRPAASSDSSSEGPSDGSSNGGAGQRTEDANRTCSDANKSIGVETISDTHGHSPLDTAQEIAATDDENTKSDSASGVCEEAVKPSPEHGLTDCLENVTTDIHDGDDVTTPDEKSRRLVASLTSEKPEVPTKPRKVSDSEATVPPAESVDGSEDVPVTVDPQGVSGQPDTGEQENSATSVTAGVALSDQDAGMPEFMKIHLHRVEAPTAMTTQVVVPKPKPRDLPSRPGATRKTEPTAGRPDDKPACPRPENKPASRLDSLPTDLPEVVLVEKRHTMSAGQPGAEDPAVARSTDGPPSPPISVKAAVDLPARSAPLPTNGSPESARTAARETAQDGEDTEPVVLRRRPAAAPSPDSELLKVFKRRSLRLASPEESAPKLAAAPADDPPPIATEEENERPRTEVVTASVSPAEARAAWSQRSVSMPAGGPRSLAARDSGPASVSAPAPEDGQSRPERPRRPPPPTQPRPAPAAVAAEPLRVRSDPSAATSAAVQSSDRRVTHGDDDGGSTADWLKQTVRERREQREQRQQQHMRRLAQKEMIIEPDNLAPVRTPPPRGSRVLEMANTFQKLQPT